MVLTEASDLLFLLSFTLACPSPTLHPSQLLYGVLLASFSPTCSGQIHHLCLKSFFIPVKYFLPLMDLLLSLLLLIHSFFQNQIDSSNGPTNGCITVKRTVILLSPLIPFLQAIHLPD
jgi:hypothetical protein